jgi:acyl carrier protein
MTESEAREAIREVLSGIAPEVVLSDCDPSEPFAREADLDSMDLLTLVSGLVERLGVDIPDSDVRSDWSLQDWAGYLVSLGS